MDKITPIDGKKRVQQQIPLRNDPAGHPMGNQPGQPAQGAAQLPGKAAQERPAPSQMPDDLLTDEEAGDILFSYTCSKGDREYHTVKDSYEGVKAHEENHIREYHDIAQKLGVKVKNPHINVYSQYFSELKRNVATGGDAQCSYSAVIDGQEVEVPVSKDGFITDTALVKKLEEEKSRRAPQGAPDSTPKKPSS